METIVQYIQKKGKGILISFFLILTFLAGNSSGVSNRGHAQTQVLGANTHTSPSVTPTPVPTTAPITIINNIIFPTQAPLRIGPTPTLGNVSPTIIVVAVTPTPTPMVSPTGILTPTPTVSLTPTPVPQTVGIEIDYAGEHEVSTYSATITPNESAWQAIQDGVGIANLRYTDYGGSLGIFITGFNGINASANQYYDFQVNGISSSVGVSSYIVNNHDQLKFVLTNF